MKRILLFIGVLTTTFSVSAQNHRLERHNLGEGSPAVYIISVSETEAIAAPESNNQDIAMKNIAVRAAIDDHRNATRKGVNQVAMPSAIFADKHNKFSFAIGGDIALRAAYSFNRIVDNIDMVP